MKRIIVLALVACSAIVAGVALAANNRPAGGRPVGLLDYQVDTIRARRVEIMGDQWEIRMVLTVYKGRPALTLYTEDGEPAVFVLVPEAGLLTTKE